MKILYSIFKLLIIAILVLYIWNLKADLNYAKLEYACLEHDGESSNIFNTVQCHDNFVKYHYNYLDNDWIKNRTRELKELSLIEHIKYTLSR